MVVVENVQSVLELRRLVSNLPDGLLYRGQNKHYVLHGGGVSLTSSQLRKGCIPSELRKWSFYAGEAITVLSGGARPELDLIQALLQHYGWRSFYVDLSESIHVACWFAANSYSEEFLIKSAEDYRNQPVLLRHRSASYQTNWGDGHVYAIAREKVVGRDVKCIDLRRSLATDFSARYERQAGWLAGPLGGPMDPECVVAHVSGPAAVFQEIAVEGGFHRTADLFPPSSEDVFLEMFEAVPWRKIGSTEPPTFARDLELPDYHVPSRGRYDKHVAFPLMRELPPEGAVTYIVPSEMFFASPENAPNELTAVAALICKHGFVRIETEELIRLPEDYRSELYCKGFYLELKKAGLVHLGALMAEHPGLDLAVGAGEVGWFYAVSANGSFTRLRHQDECSCNRPHRHERLLRAVVALDWLLKNTTVRQISPLVFDLTGS